MASSILCLTDTIFDAMSNLISASEEDDDTAMAKYEGIVRCGETAAGCTKGKRCAGRTRGALDDDGTDEYAEKAVVVVRRLIDAA